jgi:predicted amidohydrolase YtcJ
MLTHLLYNARIHTLNPEQPIATALALYHDRIVAIGGDELRTLATSQTRTTDLKGAVILPGLVDAHIHWEGTARALHIVDLMNTPSRQVAVQKVAERAAATPRGTWVLGRGWSQVDWEDGQFPSAADLDPVTPNHPVLLPARSGHAAWVNSAALRLAGISASTPDPEGGQIVRDSQGVPTGLLFETAIGLVATHIPPLTADQLADQMAVAQRLAYACGLTGLHDFDDQSAMSALQILRERGELGLRVVKNINRGFFESALKFGIRWGFGDDWLRIGGLKLFADGALGSRTASMIEPYESEPENYGIVVTDQETITELVTQATLHGLPATIHAIGDRAVHEVLNAYEAVRGVEATAGIPRSARRHRIEHVQVIHPADLNRLAELAIIASMQPIHATSDYPMADRYWGERAALGYHPLAQLDRGVQITFGSDSPVEPFEPFKGIHAAVTRQRADGSPGEAGWYPDARLTVDQAIRGYTVGAAYTAGLEDRLGQLKVGYLADLIAVDRDPYSIPPSELLKVRILATMSGGEFRYNDLE